MCDEGDTFDEFRKFPFKHLTTAPNKKRCKCYLFNHIWQSRDNSSVSHLFSSAVQEWKLRRDKCAGDITTTDNVKISSYSKRWSQRRLNNYIKISSYSFARALFKKFKCSISNWNLERWVSSIVQYCYHSILFMVKIITRKTISSSASREEHILQKILLQQRQRRHEYTTTNL